LSPFTAWENFYVIVGSSAAALTGLQFVVIVLGAEARSTRAPETMGAFGTPTVVHFCAVLLIAAVLRVPWRGVSSAGLTRSAPSGLPRDSSPHAGVHMKLVEISVGKPRDVQWRGRSVQTSIFKTPLSRRVHVARGNVEGDEQSDLSVHGGPEKAVYAYPAEHYPFWRLELPHAELPWGAFGENFT